MYDATTAYAKMEFYRDTGEHIQDEKGNLEYIPFPICNETKKPLELQYGIEAEVNCTIAEISDLFFHLLEFYVHNDAPLTCRIPSRPASTVSTIPPSPGDHIQEFVPLVFALSGALQLSHLHISTHLNILLHSSPKHHLQKHDSGVIDSGAAYSISPLAISDPESPTSKKVVIGDPLPLTFSVRWFPSPLLPTTNGKYEWAGMGGHVYASTLFYSIVSFGGGVACATVYFFGVVLPKRVRGRGLGGATPLGFGNGVGNGWGIGTGMAKRMD